jgi:hypothetical protein
MIDQARLQEWIDNRFGPKHRFNMTFARDFVAFVEEEMWPDSEPRRERPWIMYLADEARSIYWGARDQ